MYEVRDTNGQLLMYLQNCTSIQWHSKYAETGSFEIHARPSKDNLEYLKKWNHIICHDKYKLEIGFIYYVEHSSDGMEIIVKGYTDFLESIINLNTATIKDTASIGALINNNNRFGLYDLSFDTDASVDVKLEKPFDTTYKKLQETLSSFCDETDCGWKLYSTYKGLQLRIYKGNKQTSARFSDLYGNLLEQQLIEDWSTFKNIAYVLGEEKEDKSRASVVVNLKQAGDPSLELYVDARDIQSTYKDSSGVEHTYTEQQYNNMLAQRGAEKLLETRKDATKFKFKIEPDNSICSLGVDFVLGDVVPIISKRFGLSIWARVIGVDYVEEAKKKNDVSLTIDILKMEAINYESDSISLE